MQYVTLHDCKIRLFRLAIEFDPSEQTPDFTLHQKGMTDLEGILERVQSDWYPDILNKAAYLFVAVNKGHLFLNGNKRLSLLVLLDFLYRNNYFHKRISRKKYTEWFQIEFPSYAVSDTTFHTLYGWAFYNLNKAVASNTVYNFDALKSKVEAFLEMGMKMH